MSEHDEWADRLESNRTEKDQFLAEHRQSPIPPEDRDDFDGLDYFPPAPDYRVEATVTAHGDPDAVDLDATDGRTVRYLRVVTFTFDVDGNSCDLHGYRRETDGSATLFVPFRDKTTGQQTYHAGRYMELEADRDLEDAVETRSDEPSIAGALEDGDQVTIDFNLAYTPFCAFSESFSCPLPPEENWLETTIPAGERTPE